MNEREEAHCARRIRGLIKHPELVVKSISGFHRNTFAIALGDHEFE